MKNLELLVLVILVCWACISYVIAHIGGWFKLARFYRLSGAFLPAARDRGLGRGGMCHLLAGMSPHMGVCMGPRACPWGSSGERWRFQSAQLRWKIGYNNCLTVGASPEGLSLSVMFILRFGHPPLFVPWGDISVNVIKGFFYPVLEFRFQQVPTIPLRVSERLGQKIRASAGPSWPVRDSERLKLGSTHQGSREANSLT